MDNLNLLLNSWIKDLSPKKRFIVSLCCVERMLPLYEQYHSISNFGDVAKIREIMDLSWENLLLEKNLLEFLKSSLFILQSSVPSESSFYTYETLLATDFIICFESAIRILLGKKVRPTLPLEYALEARRTILIMQKTGLVDLGSDLLSKQIENEVYANPYFIQEMNYQKEDAFLMYNSQITSNNLFLLRSDTVKHKIQLFA